MLITMDKGSRKILLAVAVVVVLGLLAWLTTRMDTPRDAETSSDVTGDTPTTQTHMKITSPVFLENGTIPQEYTCDDRNVSPPLVFEGIPEGTISLALIMEDPDVPTNLRPSGVFDHWVVFNIMPDVTGVDTNELLPGIYGMNSAGKAAYTGPCPPDREHRYIFTLYALDDMLLLSQGATKEEVLIAMEGHVLEEAKLIGRYNRPGNE